LNIWLPICLNPGVINLVMDKNERIAAFLGKSNENRDASDWARADNKPNVGASRYYYALRFAAMALFDHRGLEVPDGTGQEKNSPHKRFIEAIGRELTNVDVQIERFFWEARAIRMIGDYYDYPVYPDRLDRLVDNSGILFVKIRDEIYG